MDKRIVHAWDAAQGLWETPVTLTPPQAWGGESQACWAPVSEPLAYINLTTRQVVVNFDMLDRIGASDSLTAVLAHELGHHLRFPHTLGLAAALAVLEQELMPGLQQSLTNVFFDLQVNEVVGRTRAADLARVYQGFLRTLSDVSPLFVFYLTVYNELWNTDILSPAAFDRARMDKGWPGWAAEARMFAQTFYALPDVYLQFMYFCSTFLRYVPDPANLSFRFPLAGDVPAPTPEDLSGGLYGNDQLRRALEEAQRRGWVTQSQAATAGRGSDPLPLIQRICGSGTFRQTLVAAHYRRMVDQHLFKIPIRMPTETPEPDLPGPTEPWEPGDDPWRIDWTASVLERGAMAAAQALQRDLLSDTPVPHWDGVPALEIYLDTSSSMPAPDQSTNAMSLAAQILATVAIRQRGRVRAVLYSHGEPLISPWMYDEDKAREYLLQYSGGGTSFPFDTLSRLCTESRPGEAVRIVISDDGFVWDMDRQEGAPALSLALERSVRVVLLLLLFHPAAADRAFASWSASTRLQRVVVCQPDDLSGAATRLAAALFRL